MKMMMMVMMITTVTSNYNCYCPDFPFHLSILTTFIRQGHKLSLGFTEVLIFVACFELKVSQCFVSLLFVALAPFIE